MKCRYGAMPLQQCAYDVPLHAFAFAMDQAHLAQADLAALFEIFLDDAGDFLRLKWVKIEMVFDGNDNWFDEWRAARAVDSAAILYLTLIAHKKEGKNGFLALSVNSPLRCRFQSQRLSPFNRPPTFVSAASMIERSTSFS